MPTKNDIEFRFISDGLRAVGGENEQAALEGYAVVFNRESEILGNYPRPWREIIAPGALTKFMQKAHDVRALCDHDSGEIVGRESAGNLTLKLDEKGLFVRLALPKTTTAQDLLENVRAKIITGMSFAFRPNYETIEIDNRGEYDVQIVNEIDSLTEVSFVAWPAYPQTTAVESTRSTDDFHKKHIRADYTFELNRRKLEYLKQKYLYV